jgi:metal transporter CNNM
MSSLKSLDAAAQTQTFPFLAVTQIWLLGLISSISISSPSFFLSLVATISHHVPNLPDLSNAHQLVKRSDTKHDGGFVAGIILIPILVVLSGIFAGLTLGHMSLDETELHVLSISGTFVVYLMLLTYDYMLIPPMTSSQQRKYLNQIKPIRQNGHLLLVTLLLANMIVNESLPIISDSILGGGVQHCAYCHVRVAISHPVTSALSLERVPPRRIVLTQTTSSDTRSLGSFAEIIPQSVCIRHGLYIGAKMVFFVRVLLCTLVRLSIIVRCYVSLNTVP